MLCEAFSIANGELQEFSDYFSFARIVVRRLFRVVRKYPSSCFVIPVWHCCIGGAVDPGLVV
jgi:hypothetical protein